MKNVIQNCLLSLISIIFLILFIEFVVYRFILPSCDMPGNVFENGVIKRKPNTSGIYRVKNIIKGHFMINANGWNSKHNHYSIDKDPKIIRIAIIGDSYIEALQVDYNESVAEKLELVLGHENYEVYRFAIAGAPMSQYLHILQNEVIKYKPDLVIVMLVHNDFEQSYTFVPGEYTSSFLKLSVDNNGIVEEIKPLKYQRRRYTFLKETAIMRNLLYRHCVRFQLLRDLLHGKDSQKNKYQMNTDITNLDKNVKKNKIITEYIFKKIKDICKESDTKLIIVMDGLRHHIYEHADSEGLNSLKKLGPYKLNLIAKLCAHKMNIAFIDMNQYFLNDYKINKKRFEFSPDGHYNQHGHEIVAKAIGEYIQQNF